MSLVEQMSKSLGLDTLYIEQIARRNDLYAKYRVKKKNGGTREIYHPSKELKVLQRWLAKNVFEAFPISDNSVAYSPGDCCKKNAQIHRKSRYFLHTDIKNFFPSITRQMMSRYFYLHSDIVRNLNLSDQDIDLILDICLFKGQYLVIGSPASPCISNRFLYTFDLKLAEMLNTYGDYKYTRYADDIVVSSMYYISGEIVAEIDKLMGEVGVQRNVEKTYFMNRSKKCQITGIVIDNNSYKMTVGNKKYKELQRMIYKYLVKGEGSLDSVKGYLAYLKSVSLDQYSQLANIYNRYDKNNVLFGNGRN